MLQVACGLALGALALPAPAGTNLSAWVFPGASGRLLRQPDALGNRLLDYTTVGYQGGGVPIPDVPVRVTISPVAGDNTANIQGAINAVKVLPLDTNGFRGAVMLAAGEYPCAGTITINASGIVLRGAGSGTNGTVLRATATNQYSLIRVTGSGSASTVSGTTHNVTNAYVPVGASSFLVDSTAGLAAGDRVFVQRIATDEWIHDLGMDLLGGTNAPDANPWTPGGYHLDFDRVITRLEGNRVFLNAPITCALEQRYAGGTIRKYTWSSRINNCGVEHLRGISDFAVADDEEHGWILVQFNSVEHAWARDVTARHFGYACVAFYSGTRCATAQDCQSLDPVSIITGGRRYAFVMDDCTFCLVQNCYTDEDRHQFVTQSLTTGPNVFVDGRSDTAKSDAGPHHRWATGALWDNVTVNGNALNIQNRGNLGSGHGWAGANMVAYNCYASSGFVVQKPPGAHNWLIGSVGSIKSGTVYVGPHDPGDYDASGSSATNVFPNSLYYAQMQDRLAAPNLQTREYWLGEINRFTNDIAPGERVAVDSAWKSAIQALAGGAAVNGFDVIANNQWVPFTFDFSLATTERVVAASLTLSMRAASAAAANDVLYLDSTTNTFPLANLGWTPVSTSTNPTVRVLDLASQLDLLGDGRLNVALQNDLGVDWALLELQVAPALGGGTNVLYPVADATVRGGASATVNFGTATTLTVKEDPNNDNDRKAGLRWDLSAITGTVYSARLRLTPVSVGTDGIEQCVAVTTNAAWSETGVTWNNQPFAGKRFASWIPSTNGPVEVVVTPQVQAALAGDKRLSLQLFSVRNFGASGIVDYAAREHLDATLRPQLLLLLAGSPPAIGSITNRTVGVNTNTGAIAFTIGDNATPAASLVVRGDSSNPGLVPEANIVFGGSGSNRTVTVTPAANQSGVATITVTVTDGDGLSAGTAFTLTVGSHAPGILIWNGPGAGANNWSAGGNWSPAGPPESLDDLKFYNPGADGGAVSNVNNVVDALAPGTVASLQYANSNGHHATLFAAGRRLNIVGPAGLTVGTETDNGNTQAVTATITGPAAALNINGGHLIVRQASDPANNVQRATLDLSGLGTLTANLGRLLVGTEGGIARPTGTLLLARTNLLTLAGSSPALAIGGAGGGSGNAGGISQLYLGQSNAVFTGSLSVGRVKQGFSGGVASALRFNPAFTNATPAPGPTALFRAAAGAGRVATWNIADAQSQGGTVNTAGACDFTGGTVDALVETMIVGRSSTGSGAGNPNGTLTLHAGKLDVNTLQAGVQGSAGANGGSNSATGTVNVNGGTLLVNAALQLGPTVGGTGAAATRGALNLSGGGAWLNALSTGAGTNNAISVSNGTLALTNAMGPGLNVLALTNAVLQLHVSTGAPCLLVTNLTTGGGGNAIAIGSLPGLSAYPTNLPLLKYTSLSGAGFNFTLAALPAGMGCGGYLFHNLANRSIELVVTNCVQPDAFLTWNGDVDGDWDTTTANWKNNIGPGLVYTPGRAVVIDDSATGTTDVQLTPALAPASLIVSNAGKTYTFTGLGGISGSAALMKRGTGTLLLANGGDNDFTGGVFIEAGTLQIGDGSGNGSLPPGGISNHGALVFNRSDDLVVPSLISGGGALIQDGPGELTLSGANTYSGPTTIREGTVKAGHAAALGATNGVTVVTNSATLNVNGFNLGLEPVVVSGPGETNGGAIVNHGAAIFPALANVTLAGDTTFGGTGRWDLRSADPTLTNALLSTTGHGYKLTKTGTNQVSLVAVQVDPALGDIEVREGILSLERTITSLGNPTNTLTLFGHALLHFYQVSNALNKVVVLADRAGFLNNSGANTFGGPVVLLGTNSFNIGGGSLKFTNGISGAGSLSKLGNGVLWLTASNSLTGDVWVNTGTLALTDAGGFASSGTIQIASGATLDASGRVDGRLTLAAGQTLGGDGTLAGGLIVSAGAVVSPGTSLGALTVTNEVLLQGTTRMELDAAAGTNDVIRGAALITYGGTLSLTNLNGPLAAGNAFKLFSAAGYAGAFARVEPAIPALHHAWDTTTLATDGTLRIDSAPTPQPRIAASAVSATEFVLRGTNGVPGWPFSLLTTTNVALPLPAWTSLTSNVFPLSGEFTVTSTISPATPARFFVVQLLP